MVLSEAEEAYIHAMLDMAAAVCVEDTTVWQLEQTAARTQEQSDIDAFLLKKAELIAIYTQQYLRGGLN